MKRTRTSNAWLREHVNDTYVQRAKAEGYRSRASFKLMEMDDRDHLIRPGEIVVDAHCRTNVPGIYAAGDVSTVPYKQIIISMGEGAKAALSAFDDRVRGII